MVENEIDSKINFLRSNRGGDFISHKFEEFCETHGIKRHFSVARIDNIMEWYKGRIELYKRW